MILRPIAGLKFPFFAFFAGMVLTIPAPAGATVYDLGDFPFEFFGATNVVATLETTATGVFTTETEIEKFFNSATYSVNLMDGEDIVFSMDNSNSVWDLWFGGAGATATLTVTKTGIILDFSTPQEISFARLNLWNATTFDSLAYQQDNNVFDSNFVFAENGDLISGGYAEVPYNRAFIFPANDGTKVIRQYKEETLWLCFEPVRLAYWVRTVEHNQSDAAGGSRSVWQVSFHGTGVGLWSGDEWRWNGSTSFTHIRNARGGEVQTEMQRIHAPLLGQKPNYHLWIDVHFTITPDGDTIVDWRIEEPWCQGPLPFTVIGSFETGDLTGWTASGINDGVAVVVQEGTCFSFFDTRGLTFNGSFAANVRSSGPAPIDSVGILTSDPFAAGSGIGFRALSENPLFFHDPVTLEVRVLDATGAVLQSEVVTTNNVALDPCPAGTLRDGIFSGHLVDTSLYSGEVIRVEFRQHTNYAGFGFFTLIDDVTVIP